MTAELRSTSIHGVFELKSHSVSDARGSFLNAYRAKENSFLRSWGNRGIAQVNLSRSKSVGTIRGMHLQSSPYSEAKLVRCLNGKVWDVAVDLRVDSPTFARWEAVELSPEHANAFLIPEGCAHGFQVLEPDSELLYLHSGPWIPEAESGVRWDDLEVAITWPLPPAELSERDLSLPLLSDILPTL